MNVNAIFAAAHAISEARQKQAEYEELESAARPRCGGCHWWMKSRDCPQEHNVNGMSRGPSADAMPCGKFRANSGHLRAVERLKAYELETRSNV